MDESVAEKLKLAIDPHIRRETGNIILIIGSSQCGKSTMLAEVLLPILSLSNGFITTFISPSYDSLPFQKLILSSLAKNEEERKKIRAAADSFAAGDGGSLSLKLEDIKKTKEWILTRRGYDESYIHKVYGMRLLLNKHYGDTEKVRNFRFVFALDDVIDVKGALIRKVCLTWRNRGITWVQLVQDLTNIDCAARHSAPINFFGYVNNPDRQELIVRGYLSPYLQGGHWKEKVNEYVRMTKNKSFILVNHNIRKAFWLNTATGDVQELRELTTIEDHALGSSEKEDVQRLTKEGTETPFRDEKEEGVDGFVYMFLL